MADGAAPEAADRAAWQVLGEPHTLATQASLELTQGSWLGRHPWLAGSGLPFVGWLFFMAVALLAAVPMLSPESCPHRPRSAPWKSWSIGLRGSWVRLAGPARLPDARRLELYWISAIVLTRLSTSQVCSIQPPAHAPNTGVFLLALGGIPDAIAGPVTSWFQVREHIEASGRTLYHTPSSVAPWIQMALSTIGMIAVHRWPRSSSRPDLPRPA